MNTPGGLNSVLFSHVPPPVVSGTTPAGFDFLNSTGARLSTQTESGIIPISGISVATEVSIYGGGAPQFRVCSISDCSAVVSSYGNSASIINGQYLQLRLTASSTQTTALSAVVTVGTVSDSWSVTTSAAPSGFSYALAPFVFTRGTLISRSPSITGIVESYTVSPSLPAGLSIHLTTGVISGTPTTLTTFATYTVTATGPGGFVAVGVGITIVDIAPVFTYTSPSPYTIGTAITSLFPNSTGGPVVTYSIVSPSPSLPAGLSISSTTGVISGTPTAVTAQATYTVTGVNTGGSTTGVITITVNAAAPPSSLSYNASLPYVYTSTTGTVSHFPTVSGGTVVSYTVSPSLPAGLSIHLTTGVISGSPTVITAQATYTVTATNSGGFTTFGFIITVSSVALPAFVDNVGGARTYTVPAGYASIIVELWGAGGGSMGQDNSQGAGAGGAYTRTTFNVTAGQVLYYNIGVGGIGGQSVGTAGGISWFNLTANTNPASISAGSRSSGGVGAPVAAPNNSNQLTGSIGTLINIGGAGGGGAEGGGGGAAHILGAGGVGANGNGGAGGSSGTRSGGAAGLTTTNGGDGVSNVEGGGGGGGSWNHRGGNGGIPGGAGGGGYSSANTTNTALNGANTNTHGWGGDGGRGQIRLTV